MRHEWFDLTLASTSGGRLLLACLAAALCLAHSASAQSGRKHKKADPPPAVAASAAAQQTDKPAASISTIIIGGHMIETDTKVITSNYPDKVVRACVERLKQRPLPVSNFVKVGSMKREAAIERAKSEKDAYVLWFGYKTRRVGLFDETIEYIDYFVLMPQTAKPVAEGRFIPGQYKNSTIHRGGTIRVPTARPKRVERVEDQLEEVGQELADRVRGRL